MNWGADARRYYAPLRRMIAAPGQGVWVLVMLTAVGGSCFAQSTSNPLKMRDVEMYRQIAHRIFDRIVALKDRYPHLALIANATRKEDARDKLWVAYHYAHGMSWIPNPDYNPRTKGGREVKSFSAKDGIELNLYFYEGE